MSEDPGAGVRDAAMAGIDGATSNESLPSNPPPAQDSGDRNWVTGEPGSQPVLASEAIVTEPAEPEPEDGPPARSALKADWVEHAVAQGTDPEEAENMTKAELITEHGEASER